jgi:hypothetical protein
VFDILAGLILVLLQALRVPKSLKRELFISVPRAESALVAQVLTLLVVEDLDWLEEI